MRLIFNGWSALGRSGWSSSAEFRAILDNFITIFHSVVGVMLSSNIMVLWDKLHKINASYFVISIFIT